MTGTTDPRPGDPVAETAEVRSGRIAPDRMFKPALDAARRIPKAPDPASEGPRAGARGGVPIVYGPRSLPPKGPPSPSPPPATHREPSANRAGLRPIAVQNRRFRLLALGGGTAVFIGVLTCLWWISQIAWI